MSNDPVKPPLDHVERSPMPWERATRTECGLVVEALEHGNVISREQVVAKVKDQGVQRAALSTCMTCLETVRWWPTWQQNPVAVVARAYTRVRWTADGGQAAAELRALAVLVEIHRAEFEQLLADLAGTTDLAARRAKKGRRA